MMTQSGYRESHLAPGKGEAYHRMFTENPYRRMIWRIECSIIERILATYYAGRPIEHLDFACGTGRILASLESRSTESVGVDVSPEMLELARSNATGSDIHLADLTRDDILGERKFNLVTAFRFFPNAEPELRSQALQVLLRHLSEDGYLVFNNHRNPGCLRGRLLRLLGRGNYDGMSVGDVYKLLAENGVEVVWVYHLGVLPASENRLLLPGFLLEIIERFLSRISLFRKLAENLVLVCRHSDKSEPVKDHGACNVPANDDV